MISAKALYENPCFNPNFTTIEWLADGKALIVRDWYDTLTTAARLIAREHGLRYNPLDDDQSADFWRDYEKDLGQFQRDYPSVSFGELQELLMCHHMVNERSASPYHTGWVQSKHWPLENDLDPEWAEVEIC